MVLIFKLLQALFRSFEAVRILEIKNLCHVCYICTYHGARFPRLQLLC